MVIKGELKLIIEGDNISFDYSIETENEQRVVGSFEGRLSNFSYVFCPVDCD